jgi:hypothetical protein
MKGIKNIFAGPWGIIIVGIFIGILAPLLQKLGNPANMGVCVACFERDIAGALGLHRADVAQYLRPEIMGFVLGSFIAALIAREHKPRGGSAPLIRFFLGVFAMIGALVFLGCPWRALLRLAGGDGNAILGLLGFVAGIFIGIQFLKRGYSLGRSYPQKPLSGWILPAFMAGLFLLLAFQVSFSPGGPIFFSQKGPGSQHAPIWISHRRTGPAQPFLHYGRLPGRHADPGFSSRQWRGSPADFRLWNEPHPRPVQSGVRGSAHRPYGSHLEFSRHDPVGSGICPCRGVPGETTFFVRRRRHGRGDICFGHDCRRRCGP